MPRSLLPRSLLVLCLLGLGVAHAAADAPWGLDQLLAGFSAQRSSQKRFTETKYLSVLSQPLQLSGTLSYVAPDHLEKHVLAPNEERYVVDGDTLLVENKSRNLRRSFALQSYPDIWAFVESFRATLAGNAATLRRFYALELSGDRGKWQLTLTPLQDSMLKAVAGIRIDGRADQITRIEIVEAGGDRSVMRIEDR
jgi:outer membrane lipoprotein-sorting protein